MAGEVLGCLCCYSAVSRIYRDGILDADGEEQVTHLLDLLTESWSEILPGDDIRDTALRILCSHPLRAADSLQLAAALTWADNKPKGHSFVCLDMRLREAARIEGFSLLPSRLQ